MNYTLSPLFIKITFNQFFHLLGEEIFFFILHFCIQVNTINVWKDSCFSPFCCTTSRKVKCWSPSLMGLVKAFFWSFWLGYSVTIEIRSQLGPPTGYFLESFLSQHGWEVLGWTHHIYWGFMSKDPSQCQLSLFFVLFPCIYLDKSLTEFKVSFVSQ